jgi:hypothetical protein
MKRIAMLVGALVLFVLVWAAGHDILKGEPNVWMEYTLVCAGLALAVVGVVWEVRKLRSGGRA